ncbi:hypothetical protein ISR2_1341 [Streptococcus pyogenes]|nr:hypothetical protein ISR2_1341 [Streptococcus pyogenes]
MLWWLIQTNIKSQKLSKTAPKLKKGCLKIFLSLRDIAMIF